MAGWLFRDAVLDDGERMVFRRGANLRRGWRTTGGEVTVTDRRLLFVPNRLEQLVRAPGLELARTAITDVTVVKPPPAAERWRALPGAARPRVELDTADGVVLLVLDDAEALARVLAP